MNGPLPPHRKVTVFGRVWIEEDLLAYGRQERAAERALWQETAVVSQPDPTDPGHDVAVLREQVRHLERRVRQLHAQAQQPLTREQIDAIWSAQGSFTDRESDYRSFARAIERAHGIGVKE